MFLVFARVRAIIEEYAMICDRLDLFLSRPQIVNPADFHSYNINSFLIIGYLHFLLIIYLKEKSSEDLFLKFPAFQIDQYCVNILPNYLSLISLLIQ